MKNLTEDRSRRAAIADEDCHPEITHVTNLINVWGSKVAQIYAGLLRRGQLATAAIAIFHDGVDVGSRTTLADIYRGRFPDLGARLDTPPTPGKAYVVVPFGGSEGLPGERAAGVAIFEYEPQQLVQDVRIYGTLMAGAN